MIAFSNNGMGVKMTIYIAVDIGASSGRLIKSESSSNQQFDLEEVHRFKNGFSKNGQYDCWDIDNLIHEILTGLQKIKQSGIEECVLGIDTWAVDYCLIDREGKLLRLPISYRDKRTNEAVNQFEMKMSLEKLYAKTGIQIQPFNTLFQLFVEDKSILKQTDKLLLIPDYLGYVLTGELVTEKTNASTTQLLNVVTKTWDQDLLEILGMTTNQFPPLVDAGNILGRLQRDRFPQYDLPDVRVINVASHDTASAVIGTPADVADDWAYLSSGTWSLLGVETKLFDVSKRAFQENYTNEWGAHNTIRFLKNIMGMWLIQEIARENNYQYSYPELAEMAAENLAFQRLIDVNDPSLLNPEKMSVAIQHLCEKSGQPIPITIGEIARTIYDSLAICYGMEFEKLECLLGVQDKLKKLHIVGGGSNNDFLNQLTADVIGIEVIAGPSEATAVGNLLMQQIALEDYDSIEKARQAVASSFSFKHFKPQNNYQNILQKYKKILEA